MPAYQSFDLKNWLEAEIQSSIKGLFLDDDCQKRLSSTIFEISSRFLRTPRDVVRLSNAFRLYLGGLSARIDPADLLFLQAVRINEPGLYNWIEEYVYALSAVGDWGYITPPSSRRIGGQLLDLISQDSDVQISDLRFLSEYLPGLNIGAALRDRDDFRVFDEIPRDFASTYGAACRLASPNHFRLYFALSTPTGAVSDSELESFLELAVRDEEKANEVFLDLVENRRPQGGLMAEVLLERIVERRSTIFKGVAEALLRIFGATFDELARSAGPEMGYPEFLRGERRSPFSIVLGVDEVRRPAFLKELFENAPSLSWLNGIMRSLTHDHGFEGFKGIDVSERMLSDEEFELVRKAFLSRVSSTDVDVLLETPYLLQLLYGWSQAGDKEGVMAWVEKQSETDEGLLRLLDRIRSWVGTSSGPRYPIDSKTLENFWREPDVVKSRVKRLVEEESALRAQAEKIQSAILEGERF